MSVESLLQQDFGLIADVVREHARERPQHPALIKDDDMLTYGELDALMDRIAASLQRDGLASGDAIAICAQSCIEYGAVFLGALSAGVGVAPLAPSSTNEALLGMLTDCGARKFFIDESVAKALAGTALPPGVQIIALDGGAYARSLQQWLAPVGAKPQAVQIAPDAAFNIIYSSGTTGTPKGIVQSHRMRWAHVKRASGFGYDTSAVTICSTPLYSNTTLVSFFPAFVGGGTIAEMRMVRNEGVTKGEAGGLWTPQEIAAKIDRSRHTVHDHTQAIYASLGVRSRVELVLLFAHPKLV